MSVMREPQLDWTVLLDTLERQLRDTKAAYFTGKVPGVTVADMRAAARRLLTMRRSYELSTGRKVVSDPASTAQVAALLR